VERRTSLDDGEDGVTPERWERLQALFLEASELAATEREAFLSELDPDDEDLRDELERMLSVEVPSASWPLAGRESGDGALDEDDPLLGTQLGDYRLDAVLGRGGSGVVYRATQLSKERVVAVKVLRADVSRSKSTYERFKREALAASRLHHPNLVRVLYLGRDEGRDYLVMDHVAGPNLRDQLRLCHATPPGSELELGPDLRDPRVCAALVRDLARALEHAHAERVLHRDVKPQNVLLDAEGTPHLTDFGLAKDLELADLTLSGEVAGTPHYMSPEQARAARDRIDHRTDIYSLGAVLYELLSGRTPAAGDTTAEVIDSILHKPVVPLRRRNHDVPASLALVCMQALRRRPELRYQSAGEMADDLDRFLAGESVGAKAQSLGERAQERLVDRRLLARLLPIALIVGLIGGGLIYFGSQRVYARSQRPRIEVVVAGGVDARVHYLPLDLRHLAAGPEVELGKTHGGRLSSSVVPEGAGRVLVRTEDGRFSEHYCELKAGDQLSLTAHPTDLRASETEMLVFSGGEVVPAYLPGSLAFDQSPAEERKVMLPAFAIDARCVTNGEFQAYLDASGRERPDYWSGGWRAIWDDPPREDWDALPVVDLTVADAMAYAEFYGKRLPTALELEFARGAYQQPSWLETELRRSATPGFNMFSPAMGRFGDQPRDTTGGAYFLYVQPAGEPNLPSGMRLHHALGNVGEWTESRATDLPGPQGLGARIVKADAWHSEYSSEGVTDTLLCNGIVHDDDSPQDQGFRCARSLSR
jgi:formylglycine-generating enzyme required for sulfatase activity/tRNA A-37 threonylcarbamoyl transferase component Bud32